MEKDGQSLADEISQIDKAVADATPPVLTMQQQMWIDYNALSGLITDNTQEWFDREGNPVTIKKMTIVEFAKMIDVSRETLRLWRNSVPDFWGRVNARRRELAPQSRLQKMHEAWYLKALKMDNWPVSEAWFINFDPNYETPKIKHQHEIGDNLAELLLTAERDGIIEGEVAHASNNDAGTGSQNPGILPPAS